MFVSLTERGLSRAVAAKPLRGPSGTCTGTKFAERLLDRYLRGWAEADPRKIFATTVNEYCFDDPLVGLFSRWSIGAYYGRLRSALARCGAIEAGDLAVFIRGPMGGSPAGGRAMFYREVPALGLSGVTTITFGELGVVKETVVYDLNLASDILRRA